MSNMGLYSCIAISMLGPQPQLQVTQRFDFCSKLTSSSPTSSVTIICFIAMPRITMIDVTPSPHVGEPFFIECIVDGIPAPETAWLKDGAPLEGQVLFFTYTDSIQITNLRLSGIGMHLKALPQETLGISY